MATSIVIGVYNATANLASFASTESGGAGQAAPFSFAPCKMWVPWDGHGHLYFSSGGATVWVWAKDGLLRASYGVEAPNYDTGPLRAEGWLSYAVMVSGVHPLDVAFLPIAPITANTPAQWSAAQLAHPSFDAITAAIAHPTKRKK